MAIVGIDVSKGKLDICWLKDPQAMRIKTRVFNNTDSDIRKLNDWLLSQTGKRPESVRVMMEATGIYHERLAYALYEAGFQVYVVNPQHVHSYAKSFGRRSKNDRKDSVIIARFLSDRQQELPLWQPEPQEVRHLKAMLARLNALDADIQREQNRLEKALVQKASQRVESSIRTMIDALQQERKKLEQDIDNHVDGTPSLKEDRRLLESIPGIGRVLSVELMATMRSRDFESAGQVAAFLGLVPIMRQSGSSVDERPRMSKGGSGRIRAKLYMGSIVAIQHNPMIQRQFARLVGRGKSKMSALGAAMRKLVQIAYGVLKHQTRYDPQWAA
jgi:transposase